MSNTHCKYCEITVKGLYINCPKCGRNLMHPYEPNMPPESYELATPTPTQGDDELQRIIESYGINIKAGVHEQLKKDLTAHIRRAEVAADEAGFKRGFQDAERMYRHTGTPERIDELKTCLKSVPMSSLSYEQVEARIAQLQQKESDHAK